MTELSRSELGAMIDWAVRREVPPTPWQEGNSKANPPTATELEVHRKKLVRWLNRAAKRFGRPEGKSVAGRLAQCRIGRRCLSGACPTCSGGLQRAFVAAGQRLRQRLASKGQAMSVVTIVASKVRTASLRTAGDVAKAVQLSQDLKARLEGAVGKSGTGRAYGAIDLTLNIDRRNQGKVPFQGAPFQDHWRPHAQVHMTRFLFRRTKKLLQAEFPTKPSIKRPVHGKLLNSSPRSEAYLLKRLYEPKHNGRRVTNLGQRKGAKVVVQNTRAKALSWEERVDQLIYLDHLGLNGRLVLIGCRLRLTDAGPQIRKIDEV